MKLNSELSGLIDTPAKIKLLKYVLAPGFTMTGRELARISKVSHTSVNRILKEFEAANLVFSRKAGTAVMWNVNTASYVFKKLSDFLGSKSIKPVNDLTEAVKHAFRGKGVLRAVLFGSVAKGSEKEGSDIDLFLLVKNEKEKENIGKRLKEFGAYCIKTYGNALMPYVLTGKEYAARRGLALIKDIEAGIVII